MNGTSRSRNSAGSRTVMVAESSALAAAGHLALIASAMRAAEVKSGLWSSRRSVPSWTKIAGISRSTIAPLLITPTVGWFFCTLAPPAPPEPPRNPPIVTAPCATA